ncbi:hypothetical protein LA080_012666 [Diaporthe eres]|nr:hypothetical protein LA080_012666 [Diaporthe eres]
MNSGDCWFAQFKLGWEEQALLGDSHRMLHQALISGRRARVTPNVTLRNDYSDAQKDNCKPLRKTQNSFTLSFVALALLRHNFNRHPFISDPAGCSSVWSHEQVPMSLQVVGLPDWPVSACFSPSLPSPVAHQPRNHSSSDLKAAHDRQAVTGAKPKPH